VVVGALKYWAGLWKFAPPGTAEYSVIDVPTLVGNGIAAQSLAWSEFVLGIDKESTSPLHGQFLYAAPPVKEGVTPEKHATKSEPSMIVISKAGVVEKVGLGTLSPEDAASKDRQRLKSYAVKAACCSSAPETPHHRIVAWPKG
jgi:hypothetical protein